jgi:DNA-binding NtrC family response regulator
MTHDWPGNVRELRNMVDRARLFFAGQLVEASDVAHLLPVDAARATLGVAPPTTGEAAMVDLRAMLAGIERRHISAALDAAHGVVADAARMLGLNRTTLLEKMRRHAIVRPEDAVAEPYLMAFHASVISASQSCARVNSAAA